MRHGRKRPVDKIKEEKNISKKVCENIFCLFGSLPLFHLICEFQIYLNHLETCFYTVSWRKTRTLVKFF